MSTKSWVFTINNPSCDEIDVIKNIPVKRMCAGMEIGESGTEHVQGAVIFERTHRMNAVREMLGGRAHVEKMRGTWEQQDYCLKDGEIIRVEDNSKQGERTDLKMWVTDMESGKSFEDLLGNHTSCMIRYGRFHEKFAARIAKKQSRQYRDVKVTVLWGPGGTGKTKRVLYKNDGNRNDVYIAPHDFKWWCDYENEDTILIDEFKGSLMSFEYWKRLVDGHQMKLSVKGSHTYANWKHVYITSNYHPNDWWHHVDLSMPEFSRRITEIIEM